jgi:hypothetical protein
VEGGEVGGDRTAAHLIVLVLSLAVLISAIRMKVPPYDNPRAPIASLRRAIKIMGIAIGVLGILGALKALSP